MRSIAGGAACRIVMAGLSTVALACSGGGKRPSTPLVVTSVESEAYFIRRIAGDMADVRALIPPGANPATFDPGFSTVEDMSRAVLYFKVGHPAFPFERTWLARLEEGNRLRVVDTSRGIPVLESDPHIWLSTGGARLIASNIAQGMKEAFPDSAAFFDLNLQAVISSIDSLKLVLDSLLAAAKGQAFMVFHPAFGYLAEEFGLEQIAVERNGKPPSPLDLARLIDRAKRERLKVVYVQPQHTASSMEVIAREIGAQVDTLNPVTGNWIADMSIIAGKLAKGFSN